MKGTRHIHFCRFLILLICRVAFQLMNQVNAVQTSPVVDCDQYKYSVYHPNQHNFCMPCKICSIEVESKLHNEACKKKIPHSIPGQGNAWCTGTSDKSPWCPLLSVSHGRLDCTHDNDVYSTCKLHCNLGYLPLHSNWTELKCLESLQWDISDQSLLICQRRAKPDKPSIESLGQSQEVKSGSEKTLMCVVASEVVGKRRIYWYFKDQELYSDPDLNTYVIHGASRNSEGEYFCRVEDEIGQSELSAGYFLKVKETYNDYVQQFPVGLLVGIVAVCLVVIVCTLCVKRWYSHKCVITTWHRITRHHQKEDKIIDSCLSSVGGSSTTTETIGISDSGTSDGESKQPLMTDQKLQSPSLSSETDKTLPTSKTEHLLLSKKTVSGIDNIKVSDHLLSSVVKSPANNDDVNFVFLGHGKVADIGQNHGKVADIGQNHGKVADIGQNHIKGISSADENDLRFVLKDWELMKKIRTSLDQMAEINEDKPTFHTLGRYLGASPDEIYNFEFNCRQKEISPTETYIRKMTEEGQGLSSLLSFLRHYSRTKGLAEDIENKVSYYYHTSIH